MKVDPTDHRVDQFYVFIFGFGFINEALHFAEMCVFSLSFLIGVRARSTYHRIKKYEKVSKSRPTTTMDRERNSRSQTFFYRRSGPQPVSVVLIRRRCLWRKRRVDLLISSRRISSEASAQITKEEKKRASQHV